MEAIDTIVIGAGQAGLAVSRCLTEHDRDHVVLERGRVAERWRTERWDSLRLLTSNWMTRLPGWGYDGTRPERVHERLRRRRPARALCRLLPRPLRDDSMVEAVDP
jgi:cation diffusion facilitator CzcD-associated flavoprotein CzcO